jgi:ADP-ribosyl-[dinitrogen reductase] hydrolase
MIETKRSIDLAGRFGGLLLGTAVGDALGLPAENLSADKIRKRWHGQWKMRFIFGRGMISDDTEHTLMVAQALLSHPKDVKAFQCALAWKFRWWFAGLPGGVGLATAKACLKLWAGFPASKSAVHSAGSGPAMRSAILGAYFAEEPEKRGEFVLASSRLTHRGWQAETAALAVAESVALSVMNDGNVDPAIILPALMDLSHEEEWAKLITAIELSLKAEKSVSEFACSLGLKKAVTGYSLHVVPVAVYAWLRHPGDFRTALISVLECGGDTDTAGAILGALAGVSGGKRTIPAEWLSTILEWPRSRSVMERIAARLAEEPEGQVHYFWPGLIPRNLLFFLTVIIHGFRRLLPPY